MRVAPARYITTRSTQRNLALPGNQPGTQLYLHILRGGPLRSREPRDIVMRPADIILQHLRHLGNRLVDLCPAYGYLTLPVVKLTSIFQRHLGTSRTQPGQHQLHSIGSVRGGLGRLAWGGFEKSDRHDGPPSPLRCAYSLCQTRISRLTCRCFFSRLKAASGFSKRYGYSAVFRPLAARSIRSSVPSKSRV